MQLETTWISWFAVAVLLCVCPLQCESASRFAAGRCGSDVSEPARLESMTTAFKEYLPQSLDRDREWTPYRLTSADRDCVIETMTPERLSSCWQGKWLITLGGSNNMVQAGHMRNILLGNERLQREINQGTYKETNFITLNVEFGAIIDFASTKKERDILCWGEGCHQKVTEYNPRHGYYTSLYAHTLGAVIPNLNRIKPLNMSFFPAPRIHFAIDQWLGVCAWKFAQGEDTDDVPTEDFTTTYEFRACSYSYGEIKDEPRTYDRYLEHQIELMHRNLAYLRDEWPMVKEIIHESAGYMQKLTRIFSPEVLAENGYPNIIWTRNRMDFDSDVEGDMKQDHHWMGRNPMLRNHWWLNDMCRDGRSEETYDWLVYFRDDCKDRFWLPWRQFYKVLPCFSLGDAIMPFTELNETEAPVVQLRAEIFDEFLSHVGSNSILDPTLGKVEMNLPQTTFYVALIAISSFIIAIGIISWFYPFVIERVWKTTGLTALVEVADKRTSGPLLTLETFLIVVRKRAWAFMKTFLHVLRKGVWRGVWSCLRCCCCYCFWSRCCHLPRCSRKRCKTEQDKEVLQQDVTGVSTQNEPSKSDEPEEDELLIENKVIGSKDSNDEEIRSETTTSHADDGTAGPSQQSLILPGIETTETTETRPSAGVDSSDIEASKTGPPAGAESLSEDERSVAVKTVPKLRALGMARYIASVHIVLGHSNNGTNVAPGKKAYQLDGLYTNGWGFSWVPFFMMLSGFVLTYARVNSSDPTKREPWMTFTWKRVRGIYPLFFCGLLARATQNSILRNEPISLGTPFETVSLLLLLQAWFPTVVVHSIQAHCWFLSCIVPYWALHQTVYAKLRVAQTRTLWFIALLVPLVPFLALTLIPPALGLSVTWYSTWDGWTMRNGAHYLVAMLKFHPLFYFHIYVFGIVTALLMNRMEEHPQFVRTLFRQGALIGFGGLYLIFIASYYIVIPAHKLSCRLGVLAPLQGLYLIGLALESDLVAKLFSLAIFAPLENLSYPQYVFQFIAFSSWFAWMTPGFWLWLNALSLLGYFFVQSPLKHKGKVFVVQLAGFANMFILAGFVGLVTLLLRDSNSRQSFYFFHDLPAEVELSNGAWDKRLNERLDDSVIASRGTQNLINPSLLWVESTQEMWAAVRSHRVSSTTSWFRDDQTWESNNFLGRVDPVTLEALEEFRSPFDEGMFLWEPTGDPLFGYVPSNKTYSRTAVTGPEDPCLLEVDGRIVLTASVFLPKSTSAFFWERSRLQRRMTMGTLDLDTLKFGESWLLQSESNLGSTIEKNWLAFEHRGELKYVQSLLPFRIQKAAPKQSSLAKEQFRIEMVTETALVQKQLIALELGGSLELHGGCNPIKVNRNGTAVLWPADPELEPTYLGMFHGVTNTSEYLNYFFTFSFHEDFGEEGSWLIDQVSARVHLFESKLKSAVTRPMTFASGLTAMNDGVLLSYGTSNVEARTRFLPWVVVESYFS